MLAVSDTVTLIFGSLGGIAAAVVALNTWLLRKEGARQKIIELDRASRMDLFETSQTSLKEALLRADLENERLTLRIEKQEGIISSLRKELDVLRERLEGTLRGDK